MAEGLSKGDRVRWKAGRGTASGTVERVITTKAKVGGRTVAGSKDEPRYVVKNSKTGNSVVLKRPSLRKAGGRAAAKGTRGRAKARRRPSHAPTRQLPGQKAEAPRGTRRRAAASPARPADEAAAPATAVERPVEAARMRTPTPVATRHRWQAAGALVAAVLVIGAIVLLSTGGDDDEGDSGAAATVETEEATTGVAEPVSGEPSAEALAALRDEQPFLIAGVESIPEQRIGDGQEALASQFASTYSGALAGLAPIIEAGEGTDVLTESAAYVTEELEIDRAITNAFVRESFNDGESAAILTEKTERTERALRRQLDAAGELDPPEEAAELQSAFEAARGANLAYLRAVAAAVSSRDQSALDQALRDGRAAAARAGRQIQAAASALQDRLETEAG